MYASKVQRSTKLLRSAPALLQGSSCSKDPCLHNGNKTWSYNDQVHLCFFPHGRFFGQATHTPCAAQEALSGKLADIAEGTDDLFYKIADIIGKGRWSPSIENALQAFLPLSSPTVHAVLQLDIAEESALGFFSWAGKQPGCVYHRDDVNQVAYLWATKYGPGKLTSMQENLISMGSQYGEVAWAAMIVAYTILRRAAHGVTIFMEMKKSGCKPTYLSYEPLLFALVKCNRVDAALFTAQDMLTSGILPEDKALGALLDGLCKTGKSETAFGFVHEIGRLGPVSYHEYAYSRLITAVWRTGSNAMALELLHEMKTKGLKPDRHAYTVCVKLLCRNHRFDMAQNLLTEMTKQNCAPDMLTYTALINGLYKGGKVTEALGVAELMRKQGGPLDCRMYTAILNCLFVAGRVNDAVQTFEQMVEEGHPADLVAYFVMIKNLCEAGDVKRALDIKKAMNEKGFQPDARLYLALSRGLCAGSSHVEELLHLVEEMRTKGYSPTAEVYLTLTTHFCTQGNFDRARIWAKEMISKGYQPTPYIRTKFSTELGDIFEV